MAEKYTAGTALSALVERYQITAESTWVTATDSGHLWDVKLHRPEEASMEIDMFGAPQHYTDGPDAVLVLRALIDDACTFHQANGFLEWAAELGMVADTDAEDRYDTVERQTSDLDLFLGDAYEEFEEAL